MGSIKTQTGLVVLSKRLGAAADMVDQGSIVADVGCDHGYTSIYLLQNGICPRVYAMDVNAGPLERAGEHVREYGLSAYINLIQSDGLKELPVGPDGRPAADTLLAAGMGGRLMVRILEDSRDKTAAMRVLILQPQSELKAVRTYLRRTGYLISNENMLVEDGKYYTVLKAINMALEDSGAAKAQEDTKGSFDWWQEMCDCYGKLLILRKHPVLMEFLKERLEMDRSILSRLRDAGGAGRSQQRLAELEKESADITGVLKRMQEIG